MPITSPASTRKLISVKTGSVELYPKVDVSETLAKM